MMRVIILRFRCLKFVRAFLAEKAPDIAVIELEGSSATVALAAEGHGVKPAQIAKTLSLRVGERNLLVVTRGDARLDNKKAKAAFGGKARMLNAEEVLAVTGHPVGGVSPFGLATALPVDCDRQRLHFTMNNLYCICLGGMAQEIALEWPSGFGNSCHNKGKTISHELGVCPCLSRRESPRHCHC